MRHFRSFSTLKSSKTKCAFGGFKGVQKKHCNCHGTYTSRHWGYSRSDPDCFFKANITNQTVTMFALRVLHQLNKQMCTQLFKSIYSFGQKSYDNPTELTFTVMHLGAQDSAILRRNFSNYHNWVYSYVKYNCSGL